MSDILYTGKSKNVFPGPDKDSLIIRYKDTATAFNGEKKEELLGKGKLNAAISNLIFRFLQERGIKTHFIKEIDETSILVRKADIIMVELIIRNIAAGSFSKKYGIAEGRELKNTVLEFCLKSDSLGDPMINMSQITAIGIASREELDSMINMAEKINVLLIDLFLKAEIKLVDFKLEFGRCGNDIILCDEISPDSCRFWDLHTGDKMDKDRFRRDMGNVLEGYGMVLDRLKRIVLMNT